jgi:hypothetical protein
MSTSQPDREQPTVCTVAGPSVCQNCTLAETLNCRFRWFDLLRFYGLFAIFAVPAVTGLLRGGQGGALLGWFAFSMFFFNVWESRILCRHCPYYAGPGPVLRCIANYGMLKPFRFNPAPMSRWEKAQFLFGVVLLFGIPLPFLVVADQWALLSLTVLGGVVWFLVMQQSVCSACVNFSCPLNRVPKVRIDAYLKRNPIMRQAWEAHGWQVE